MTGPISGPPTESVAVPGVVAARSRRAEAVWRNMVGGLTFHDADAGVFLKWNPRGNGVSLAAERDRLLWAATVGHPVPEVVDHVVDDEGELLVTRALDGDGAVTPRWVADPRTAVRAIGEGLRAMHELPVADCPFDWSLEHRLAGRDDAARGLLAAAPPIDRLVVCHGDACAPNTIIGRDGRWAGHVDLAELGVADRWADLAVTTVSLGWNYGEGWEDELFAAYGIEPDRERVAYYRAVWDAE